MPADGTAARGSTGEQPEGRRSSLAAQAAQGRAEFRTPTARPLRPAAHDPVRTAGSCGPHRIPRPLQLPTPVIKPRHHNSYNSAQQGGRTFSR
jgi:hypothetical protein